MGTAADNKQAYYWARKAIESNEGKGFYQVGRILEIEAKKRRQATQLLELARQSYEIAKENGVGNTEGLSRVNAALHPNRFSPHAYEFSLPSGRMVNGDFVAEADELSWYLLKTNIADQKGNVFAIARNTHEHASQTVWYQHSKNKGESGWYMSFKITANIKKVNSIAVTSSIAGKKETIALDFSDQKKKDDLFSNTMTGRLNFRDVLLLAAGEMVEINYLNSDLRNQKWITTKKKYTMALNHSSMVDGKNSMQTANYVISNLITAARKLNRNCCDTPDIEPLGEDYNKLLTICKTAAGNYWAPKEGIQQDCHTILKNSPREYGLAVDPLQTNLARVLREIDGELKK